MLDHIWHLLPEGHSVPTGTGMGPDGIPRIRALTLGNFDAQSSQVNMRDKEAASILLFYLEAQVRVEAVTSPPTPSSLSSRCLYSYSSRGAEVATPRLQWVCVDAAHALHSSATLKHGSWRESGRVRDCQQPSILPAWLQAWADALHVAAWLAQTILLP